MRDQDCIRFLQWALPQLRMRWPGFRKVRRQVCKRIQRRMDELGLADVDTYRAHLGEHAPEWTVLDRLCRVTISRFYRDKEVFRFLGGEVLPELARQALTRRDRTLRLWSAGCGSGEEPYTLVLLWKFELQSHFPDLDLHILATDSDPTLIRRAEEALYSASSLKDLPAEWKEAAFVEVAGGYVLRPEFRTSVDLHCQDLRKTVAAGPFDLVLCRNLAFTYWDLGLQTDVAQRIRDVLTPGGALAVGAHEALPASVESIVPWEEGHGIYRRPAHPLT